MVRYARRRPVLRLLVLAALVACTEQQFRLGFERDITAPSVDILKTLGDTLDVSQGIVFTVQATDNLGLKTISIAFTGGLTGTIDTTFTTAVRDIGLGVRIALLTNTTVGGNIGIQATAVDGNGNTARDVDSLFLVNLAALLVTVEQPPAGQVTGPGVQMPIVIRATQSAGVRRVGYFVFGNVTAADSATFPLPDTALFNDTLLVPVTATAGQFFIQGFAIDSANRRASSSVRTVTIQQVLVDTIPPIVSFTVNKRVEVGDTITVIASDPSGIIRLGWIGTDTTAAANLIGGDSATLGTPQSPVTRAFRLVFPAASLGQAVRLRAFAVDAANNRGFALLVNDTTLRQDTVIVASGITRPLPQGGRIVDAIYNPNRNEVYLTNIELDRMEVFRIVDTTFGSPGIMGRGSRPWGITLWPRDTTTGANADTVLVANSGGTNISVVNVAATPPREVRRHALPTWRVQTVKTVQSEAGFLTQEITEHLFDDRPQYLGAVCRGGNCASGGGGEVVAVYSTTPTQGQTTPFSRRASVRWEKITNPGVAESHFFWEQAAAQASAVNDTLQIFVRRGLTETLLLHALCGVRIAIPELGFLDTTFVRNSGNFARALMGEGGSGSPVLAFARAIAYDAHTGIDPTCAFDTTTPPDGVADVFFPETRDLGVSASINVRNFITNTAVSVKGVALNFNGLTNLIRADSIYVLDRYLRLQGLVAVGGLNRGMDVNFDHNFDATVEASPTGLSPNDRIVFMASELPEILVYDTYFYGRAAASIPIRDPVTGPLRVAKLPTGEQLLVGVTARGVVTVRLPPITNVLQGPRQ